MYEMIDKGTFESMEKEVVLGLIYKRAKCKMESIYDVYTLNEKSTFIIIQDNVVLEMNNCGKKWENGKYLQTFSEISSEVEGQLMNSSKASSRFLVCLPGLPAEEEDKGISEGLDMWDTASSPLSGLTAGELGACGKQSPCHNC